MATYKMNTRVELWSRHLVTRNGIETSQFRSDCICGAERVIKEFRCPRSGCGVTRKEIQDPDKACQTHNPPPIMMCGGVVEMCDPCALMGYVAFNGSGGGMMEIRNDTTGYQETYRPKYVRHPSLPPPELF
jgi:hypothetical protein